MISVGSTIPYFQNACVRPLAPDVCNWLPTASNCNPHRIPTTKCDYLVPGGTPFPFWKAIAIGLLSDTLKQNQLTGSPVTHYTVLESDSGGPDHHDPEGACCGLWLDSRSCRSTSNRRICDHRPGPLPQMPRLPPICRFAQGFPRRPTVRQHSSQHELSPLKPIPIEVVTDHFPNPRFTGKVDDTFCSNHIILLPSS